MAFTFVLGGARSGKSGWAQREAEAVGGRLKMIVTGEANDAEMADRIARHRAERGERWTTIEAPLALSSAIEALEPGDVAVVDCLTLWLSHLMLVGAPLQPAFAGLEAAAGACPARLWLVSNEVGQGIVPDNALARQFRDEAGRLHQRLAARAEAVVLMTAGLPLWLKC